MSSTCSLFSSLDCFTDDGLFYPSSEIQFNRYAQDDDTGVISIELCQTEGSDECDDDLAYVIRHPDYVAATLENDIALIILPEDLPGDIEQLVANLPNVELNCDPDIPAVGQELEAFGWGATCESGGTECPDSEYPNDIQTGKLEYLTNGECDNLYDGGITGDMLCANTDSTDGVAVGNADSGTCNSCWASIFSIMTNYDITSWMPLFIIYPPHTKSNIRGHLWMNLMFK
jgi:hypothetical protein